MAFAPDGRLFFTEKATGAVRVVSAEGILADDPVLTVAVDSTGETGLLGIALHPAFGEGAPWLYLYLSDPTDGMNRLVRVRVAGDLAHGAPRPLLRTVPATNAYHNGGDLLFGPDGMLYVAVGEAHEPDRAQDPDDLGGKILRLSPDGTPAPGNPLGEGNAAYTLGHRNSFGLCVDPATGEIWETENGPDRDDEVNRLVPGADHGWPVVTGDSGGAFADPVAVFPETVAPTGCAWWRGDLLVGAWKDGRVRSIDPRSGDAREIFGFPAGVTDLQVGPDDALYVTTADAIWRMTRLPTGGPLGPDPMPEPPSEDDTRGWIAIVAAIVLAAALIVRLRAARRLRGAGVPPDPREREAL
jgi:quinoprotein glucose dehydrogenase